MFIQIYVNLKLIENLNILAAYGQSGHGTLKLTACRKNKWIEWTHFLHAGENSGKL